MDGSKNEKIKTKNQLVRILKKYKNFLDSNYFKANENCNNDSSSSNKRAKKRAKSFSQKSKSLFFIRSN